MESALLAWPETLWCFFSQSGLPELLQTLTLQGGDNSPSSLATSDKNALEEVMAPYNTVTVTLPSGSEGSSSLQCQYSSLQEDPE